MKTILLLSIQYTLISICTPPVKIIEGLDYSSRFSNQTDTEIQLLFYSSSSDADSLTIQSLSWEIFNTFNVPEKEDVIRNYVDEFILINDSLNLLIDNETAITWLRLSSFGENFTNSPFNYNSWTLDEEGKFIQFTITNADLGLDE